MKQHIKFIPFILAFTFGAHLALAMDAAQFSDLLTRLEHDNFSYQDIIETAASTNTFTSQQVAQILSKTSFGSDQLKALEALKDKIEDVEQNKQNILAIFTFDSDRQNARALLASSTNATKLGADDNFPNLSFSDYRSDSEVSALISQLQGESFSNGKLDVLTHDSSANAQGFISSQLVRILNEFDFSADKIRALQILDERILEMRSADVIKLIEAFKFSDDKLKVLSQVKDLIVDAGNKFNILGAFTFSGDREKARTILSSVKRRSYIYGTVTSKRVVFVVDISGSMEARVQTNIGPLSRLDMVKKELVSVLNTQLMPGVKFDIIYFSDSVYSQSRSTALLDVNTLNILSAVTNLSATAPSGGTNIYGALSNAFSRPDVDTVYFLTDGTPTVGEVTDVSQILAFVQSQNGSRAKKIRINATAFLTGYFNGDNKAASKTLMRRLAENTGGTYRAIE